jgi:hypothetical protein
MDGHNSLAVPDLAHLLAMALFGCTRQPVGSHPCAKNAQGWGTLSWSGAKGGPALGPAPRPQNPERRFSPRQELVSVNIKLRIRARPEFVQIHSLELAFALDALPIEAIQQPVQSIRQWQDKAQ